MINKFIGQYRSEERLATKYDAGRITKNGVQFCIGYEMGGAEETFSVGQPIYDKDFNLMGYLGIGLWGHLDYACDMRIPVEVWTVCLPTEHCIEGKHVYTYWQMLEMKGENKEEHIHELNLNIKNGVATLEYSVRKIIPLELRIGEKE